MKRMIRVWLTGLVLSVCGGLAFGGTIDVTRIAWNAATAKTEFTLRAAASLKARTVYLVWDAADRGANWLDWERGEVLGTLSAGATTATFSASLAARYGMAYRVFTFDATETGDAYLAYITSTGSQYLNTGIKPSYQSAAWIDYNWNDTTGQCRAFGVYGTFVFNHYISGTAASGGCLAMACKDGDGQWYNNGTVVNKNRITVTIDSYANSGAGIFRIERDGNLPCDKTITSIGGARTKTADRPLYVCANNNDTKGTAGCKAKINLYRFKLWEAGEAKADYRPYVKDGVAGVLDAVSGNFIKSAVTTAFVAGTRLGAAPLDDSGAVDAKVGAIIGGTATYSYLTGGSVSELAGVDSLVLRNATFKYEGKEGEKGYYEGDVAMAAGTRKQAVTFDITGDLTFSGKFENTSTYGAFIKTGPGTLRIPGNPNATYTIQGSSIWESEKSLDVLKPKADGTTPDQGYQILTLAEGRLVLGENGGKFAIRPKDGTDIQIGRLTVDPLTQAGQQEKEAVLEVAGGTTIVYNWTNVGGKNGFVTTTPDKVPESGVRVTGGTLIFTNSITFGRNKAASPQKDAKGNWIRQRCCPFIEVLGGTLQLFNTSRVGFCDDPGADTRVLVDKGTLIVKHSSGSGSGIMLGCCADGDTTAPRTCNITVRNGGRLDCTDFWINNASSIHNITCNIEVVEGGIYRNNTMRKCNTSADCQLNMLFDDGIAELRWAGYENWIDKDITKVAIGTRGALFRAGTGSGCDVWHQLHHVKVPLVAEETHPDEEPQGLTIGCTGTDRNGGWIFHKANTYLGPTKVTASGRLEFTEEGTFPATSDVIMGAGRLVLTNMAHTVKSLTFGVSQAFEKPYIALVAGQPITVKGPFAVTARVSPLMQLYSAPYVPLTNVTDVGSHDLIRVPVAYKAALAQIAATATWYNPGDGLAATFTAEEDGDEAVLKVTLTTGVGPTLHPSAGGTEDVTSFEDLRDLETGLVRLGMGTLVYSGTGEILSGMVDCAGAGEKGAAILQIAHDLTLLDFLTQDGRLYKTGPGDLKLMGTGTFILGTRNMAYDTNKPQGIDEDGNPPNNASVGFSVTDGRVIVGVKDDPENAPHVIARAHLAIGTRTVAPGSGKMETAGEFIMNNGVLDVTGLYLSYYCGTPDTTPPEGLHPRFVMNGGTVNQSGDTLNMGHDWVGLQTTSPEFIMNGGYFNSSNNCNVGFQVSTGMVDNVNTFTLNAGTFRCYDFVIGSSTYKTTTAKSVVRFNGGDLIYHNFYHYGKATSDNKGYAEVYFNGTALHPGDRRPLLFSCHFPQEGTTADNRINKAFVGKGGMIFDFDVWMSAGTSGDCINFRQPLLHDPACEGEDGGLTLRNGATVIFRDSANGCTFTGPVVAENGSVIGLDNGWNGFVDANRKFIIRNGGGFRLSGQVGYLTNVQLGEEGDTAPVTLDLCEPLAAVTGLAATKTITVKAPVTVSFHRNAGMCNSIGTWFGTTDVLYYPADQDANVPLEKFVANPLLPGVKMTFAKGTVASGTYAGYRKITVTTTRDYASGTAWTSTSAGGAWEEGANWEGGTPVNATNAVATFRAATGEAVGVTVGETTPTAGTIALHGDDAAKGYAFTGGAINLHNVTWNEAGSVVAVSGSHTIANALTTDNNYNMTGESAGNNGQAGSVGIKAHTGATLTVTGEMRPDASYPVVVNPAPDGGGKVLFRGSVESGTGMTVQSGTLDLDDFRRLNGKTLTIGPATVHYTGPDAVIESPITITHTTTNLTSVLRNDNRIVANGRIWTTKGSFMKTGPGELVVNAKGTNRLGENNSNVRWNNETAWPANGDSLVQGNGGFCLDEGTVTFGREGQHVALATWCDVFIGSQRRGWSYTTDTVTLNIRGGYGFVSVLGVGHGMKRGTDGNDPAYVVYNQYAGTITNNCTYIGYNLTDFNNHVRANMNLYGGTYLVQNYIRLGQTYNKTSVNEPYSTLLVDGGTLWFNRNSTDRAGNIYVPYSENIEQLRQCQNRAPDAQLVVKNGMVTNAYLIAVGQNGGRGEVHLDGGLLDCENLVHHTYDQTDSLSYYHAFNVKDGTSYVYFNGGVFQPHAAMDQTKQDTKARLDWNATLANFTDLIVRADGARISTAALKAERYTLAQTLTHDAALGNEPDGGLEKTGKGVLAMAAQMTYTGETRIEEGTLLVTKEAPEGELLPNSTLRVAAGATLEFEKGAKATISKIAIDCAGGTDVTLKNLSLAKEGTIYLTNVSGTPTEGFALPVSVVGKLRMSRWQVYVNGVKYEGALKPVVRDGKLVLGLSNGLAIIVR